MSEAPEGYHYEWQPAGEPWRIGGDDRKCRMLRCPNRAVAALQRRHGRGSVWWHYCTEHLYGRKIENGVILERCLVPNVEDKSA